MLFLVYWSPLTNWRDMESSHWSYYNVSDTIPRASLSSPHPKVKKGKEGDRRINLAIWMLHIHYIIVLVVRFMWQILQRIIWYPSKFTRENLLCGKSLILQVVALRTSSRALGYLSPGVKGEGSHSQMREGSYIHLYIKVGARGCHRTWHDKKN